MNRSHPRASRGFCVAWLVVMAVTAQGCTLIGFGIGAKVDGAKKDVEIAGWQFEEVTPGTRLDLILKSGTTVSGTYLGRGGAGNAGPASPEPPASSAIQLRVGKKNLTFATDDVGLVRIRANRNGKEIGALVGVVVDAALIIATINSLDNLELFPKCRPPDCSGSCPFAYSYDGRAYTLEAEMFGGAIFKASQRSDRVRFERLAARGGEYRVRLENHNHEIQYVDGVRLLLVDHPEGAEILPSLDGQLVTFTRRVPPARAADLRGANILSLVRNDDGTSWISTPFGRDPDDPDELRDGLVLEFPRPSGAETVKLAFTVRSTPWAAGLLNHLVGLQGREVDAWRDKMNARPVERMAFLAALRREGLLRLSVWDGTGWRDAGVLANVGPGAARRQAVRLDLRGLAGSTVRLRLDATPGMWTVDAVAADYSADLPSDVRELAPVRATGHDGRDLRDALAASDGRYYTMPTTDDAADLAFAAPPPPRPGQRRTFIFEATGYYSILVPPTEPRLALFDSLVSTPGEFARHSFRLAAEEMIEARSRLAAVRAGSQASGPRSGKEPRH